MEPLIGQTVSHYAFLEKLGAGGMGEIYKARDSRLNRMVAVKVLAPGKTRDPNGRRRFIQEAQAASALNHPNIITIHDILPEGDTQYMVMEFVSGKTLHDLISAGRLSIPQVLQLSTQMANALGVAHAAGIIHRDFKPANVMVTGTGLVKILDFGLAKLTDLSSRMEVTSDGYQNTLTAAPLTREGSIMGTVNYMSPEQAEGLKVDGRSDIFSFGAVLYEMVTGHRAFDGDSGISTLSAVLRDEVKPIELMAPDVPPELVNIVNRCLRKNAAARWQSMTEVEVELNNLKRRSDSGVLHAPPVTGLPVSSPPLSSPPASGAPASNLPVSIPPAPSLPAPSVTPSVAVPGSGMRKAILLGAVCLVVLAIAAGAAWWTMHKRQTAAIAAAPAPVSPAPAPAAPAPASPPPTAAPATPSPTPEPVVPAPATPAPTTPAPAKPGPAKPSATKPSVTSPGTAPTVLPAAPKSVSPYAPQAPVIAAAPPVATPVAPPPPTPRVVPPPVVRELVPVKLNDGMPFRIALVDDVPADSEVGRALRFRVIEDVQAGDTTVIAKGSIVTGSLADLGGKKNFFGQSSKVRFRLIAAESVDDAKINVRATPSRKSDGVESRPFATPNGTKDKELIAASGTEYIAYISGNQTVSVHK